MLNVTARLAALVSLLIQSRPILDGATKPPEVYEVEKIRVIGPFLIVVVDFKPDIGGYPTGLDGRDISTHDVAVREFIGKIDCPQP